MLGAIFDVDGTLLDTMSVWHNLTKQFLKKRGHTLSDELAVQYKDMILSESLPHLKSHFHLKESVEEINREFHEMGAYAYKYRVPLKPYADDYLKKLHQSGVKIAIATSGYPTLCEAAFKRLHIWDYIDECAFSSEVGVSKANPDIYLLAAKRLDIPPADCMVYEDIALGIMGAKKGGFMTTGIYDASSSDETTALKQLCDHYITGWEQLL